MSDVLAECVVNISEGRNSRVIDTVAAAGGSSLLDVHTDRDHHRSVLTLGGPLGQLELHVRSVVAAAIDHIDLRDHQGVHPRFGAVDVAPFVPLRGTLSDAIAARDRLGSWAGNVLELPCFPYGPEHRLPDVRREAFRGLGPTWGPATPHPTAGAMAVGARPVLVAYNLWLAPVHPAANEATGHHGDSLALAKSIAAAIRGPAVRSLGLAVGTSAQVSCNLIEPVGMGPATIFDIVTRLAHDAGRAVQRAELVGLVPMVVLETIPERRWESLDLAIDKTIEERLARCQPAIATELQING